MLSLRFLAVLGALVGSPIASAMPRDPDAPGTLNSTLPSNSTLPFNSTLPSKLHNSLAGSSQQIAIASYVHPNADKDAWNRMIAMDSGKVGVLVANVANGPDSVKVDEWDSVISRAHDSGKLVIGYVRTGYLGVSWQGFKTRLGSTRLSDWVAQIEQDVDMWYELYGNKMGGIFFDEGWNECGENDEYAKLYEYINWNTKRKYPGAYTVLNPGDSMPRCFEHTSDTLLTFESSYERYTDGSSYKANNWEASDNRKIWHIVYNVPQSKVREVAALALERGAGFIQATDDVMENPYDNIPNAAYMQEHLDAVSGGSPFVAVAPPLPTDRGVGIGNPLQDRTLTVTDTDYTAVSLQWAAVGDHYEVRVKETNQGLSLPRAMQAVTIGGLKPNTQYTFEVVVLYQNNEVWTTTQTATATTKDLPNGDMITNWKSESSLSQTIISADVLVPFAFVRAYIWKSRACYLPDKPYYPIYYDVGKYVCVAYMVENEKLYKSIAVTEPGGNTPWKWEFVSKAPLVESGKNMKWTLDLGKTTLDTRRIIVQGEGYNAYTNKFAPDPSELENNCKGSNLCSNILESEFSGWCQKAVDGIDQGEKAVYKNGKGNCWGDQVRACGVFIEGGDHCQISGAGLVTMYTMIREDAGCKKCGSWSLDTPEQAGCRVVINYVDGSGCSNH